LAPMAYRRLPKRALACTYAVSPSATWLIYCRFYRP
jgi:hypothetical protein